MALAGMERIAAHRVTFSEIFAGPVDLAPIRCDIG